jgi:hypothetical protein
MSEESPQYGRPKMSGDTPADLFLEGVATGVERLLANQKFVDLLAGKVADAIALRFEILEPEAAAALLGVTARTLNDNHIDWSLDKSLAFGATNPRYFLSQIIERAREKVRKGKQSLRLASAA